MNWKEFKPVIYFLLRFLGIYLIGNLVYGLFITSFEPGVDPITYWVTNHTAFLMRLFNYQAVAQALIDKNIADLLVNNKVALSVYEGCNGVNVWIIFVAFLFALGPISRKLWYFLGVGTVIIHISNLVRIFLLAIVYMYLPHYWYFSHKYLFTAFIYVIVFILWLIWVRQQLRYAKQQ
ncbi:MAG: exosortase family protein XrtF [Cyclobacteriaceae bacterium]|jgi:exosortase family protein XrtF|nr:exosortase family protein XrtF [Cyclobacteriaceae bacterium]